MEQKKEFYETVTLWSNKEKRPVFTRAFTDRDSYIQYIEDHWHDEEYSVEYAGNRHLFPKQ